MEVAILAEFLSQHLHEMGPWGYYLETDPDPVAMVIRVELFIHKPCTQMTPLT